MRSTTPRRFAAALASAGAGALVVAGAAAPASAADTKPDTAEVGGDYKLSTTKAVDPAASGPERLAAHAESTLQAAADRAEMSLSAVQDLVESDQAVVGQGGLLSFTDVFDGIDDLDLGDAEPADVPGDPASGSKPGAPYTVYLDFDGAKLENTEWNRYYGQDVYDLTADSAASDAAYVEHVWSVVAEDFAPFNINVTTTDPGKDALLRTSEDDTEFGMTAVITDTTDVPMAADASGRAWLGGFGNAFYSPALIFAPVLRSEPAWVGNTVSHEVGHTFGLTHDGIGEDEYYGSTPGEPTSLWGPIMGAPFATPLSQWSPGDYPGATSPDQDDLVEISKGADGNFRYAVLYRQDGTFWTDAYCTTAEDPNNPGPGDKIYETNAQGGCNPPGPELTAEFTFGGRAEYSEDEVGNDTDGAADIDNGSGEFEVDGVIETAKDRDMYRLVTSGGDVSLSATPASVNPNLDILLQVFDADGNVVAEENPEASTDITSPQTDRTASGLDASVEQELEAGVYFVGVSGTGQGDPANNTPSNGSGYTDYGSLGNFTLSGTAEPFEAAPISITAPEDGAEVERSGLEVTGAAEAGASVSLTVGDDVVGEATAGEEGNWAATLDGDLPYGKSTITAQQTVNGIKVPATAEVGVVVAVDAPEISKPEDGDTATTATPVFSGTGVAGAKVTVMITCGEDFTLEGTAEVDGEGAWEYEAEKDLPAGECSVSATQTINEVTSSEAGPVKFTVDVESGGENGDDSGDDSGNEDGSESGDENGDEDLPDTGAGSSNLIALAGGLVLLGLGAALYARTRRSVES